VISDEQPDAREGQTGRAGVTESYSLYPKRHLMRCNNMSVTGG